MSKASTKPPSGMRDFLPAELARRAHVIDVVRRVYGSYGFVPIETPTIENLSTLLGKYGDEGDQLLYRLLHRRDNLTRALAIEGVGEADLADQGLRYDLTVPLARVVANYDLPKYFKRYQIQPVWRADRPGRGRFREFYQCDVDITGTTSAIAEAEVCAAVAEVLHQLGFAEFEIRLNHREVLRAMIRASAIDAALEGSALVAIDKLDKIGPEGVRGELAERGIAPESAERLLAFVAADPDAEPLPALADLRGRLADERGQAALDELSALIELCAGTPAAAHLRFAPDLARGLSYYTGAIFEIAVPDLASSLGGGGRYDDLVGMFGKKKVPAVGFSLGLERILVVMEERGMFPPLALGPELLLCWLDAAPAAVLAVAAKLRAQGVRVEVFPEKAKLGKQLGYADTPGVKAPYAGILGREEIDAAMITLKNLASGAQVRVPVAEAGALIATWREG
ncbi:MAG: histidine--tRNA ligase [Myxococcales bacterium]|nr:histidine--tRNA ligase [Myxococcales bacterium]